MYFGNGAYGVESAMRTYFGDANAATIGPNGLPDEPDPGHKLARDATPAERRFSPG